MINLDQQCECLCAQTTLSVLPFSTLSAVPKPPSIIHRFLVDLSTFALQMRVRVWGVGGILTIEFWWLIAKVIDFELQAAVYLKGWEWWIFKSCLYDGPPCYLMQVLCKCEKIAYLPGMLWWPSYGCVAADMWHVWRPFSNDPMSRFHVILPEPQPPHFLEATFPFPIHRKFLSPKLIA